MTRIIGFPANLIPELVDIYDKGLLLQFLDKEKQPLNIFITKDDAEILLVLLRSFLIGQNRIINPCNVDSYGELMQ